ncbi:class I SAM-dependent methyltransferase [Bradyrhizobium liaoningense]|uniref:class I SAM-dependent methyltransferase n=1 Tax=Bradyrhizobium liaoningense TaxID=43992 RepID=UPI0007C52F8E|nr:class I SAM-dependent methyltransferase [Bradyrhizobium liaoningense]
MLNWIDDSCFEIDGYRITLDWQHGGSPRHSSDRDFIMMKGRDFLDHYTTLVNRNIEKVLEVGIYQGGSVIFLDKLLRPKKLSAVELSPNKIPALEKYASESEGRVNIYHGTSQDDAEKLKEIIDRDFNGQIDLVVDDASHWYEYTKATFKTVFPHLKPGGYYFIEDWNWSFQPAFQDESHAWFDRNSLANLVIDLMEDMVCSNAIESVQIAPQMIKVKRSDAQARPLFATAARRSRAIALL